MDTYHVIGLMSGTSLDGLDIAYCRFTYENENWIYNILNANTLIYEDCWIDSLREAENMPARHLIALDHVFGKFLGEQVQKFIKELNIRPDFIASHGHTVFHQPEQNLSLQIGNGAYLAAQAQLPVVCDFRTLDIALGGQGAPLVPIGDELLFKEYDFCINLGGISNASFSKGGKRLAFDISACNMLLNNLAIRLGMPYDEGGNTARHGNFQQELFDQLNAPSYFSAPYPKSLGKEWVLEHSLATLENYNASVEDKLHTVCHHIAAQLKNALIPLHNGLHRVLITGGGAFNTFLVELIQEKLGNAYKVEVPAPEVISFKEALIFAFLGVLRWRGEHNSLQSVTGASRNNTGGAIYLG